MSWSFRVAEIWVDGETGRTYQLGGDDRTRQGAKTEKSLVMKALNKLIFIDKDTQASKGSATRKEPMILKLHPSFV